MRILYGAITAALWIMPAACAASGHGTGRVAAESAAVRVTWVRPDRVSPSRRAALTRLLVAAVQGRPLRAFAVRDSRPTFNSECLPEPGRSTAVPGSQRRAGRPAISSDSVVGFVMGAAGANRG